MPVRFPHGSLGRCLSLLLMPQQMALVLSCSSPTASAVGPQAPQQGVTSQPLGNLLSPAVH